MAERNIGEEILDGLREIKRFQSGEGRLHTRVLTDPSPPKAIREKLRLSQSSFATLMGVSYRTIQDWEQGRRNPCGPAKSMLRVAEQFPEVFMHLTKN